MTNRHIITIIFCGIFWAHLSLRNVQAEESVSFETYNVITQHNMFLRDRPRERQTITVRQPTAPIVRRETFPTLTGVIRQGEEYIAFIEDTQKNTTSRIRLGETIAGGQVESMTLDGIVYVKDGESKEINVGQSLSGEKANLSSSGFSFENRNTQTTFNSNSTETTETPSSGGTEGGDMSEILKRLREKRQKELNNK